MQKTARILINGQREANIIKEKTNLGKSSVDVLLLASIRRTITSPACVAQTGWSPFAVNKALARLSKMNYLSTFRNLKRPGEKKHYRITGTGRRMINKYLEACQKE